MKNSQKNFRYYLFELLVVFAGVSLAFAFDRIYDSYKESVDEKKYLRSFSSDLKSDLASIDTLINRNSKNLEVMEAIISDFDESSEEERKEMQAEIIAVMLSQFKFEKQTSTYEALKYAGNLAIISNQELRTNIVDLYLGYESINLIEQVYNDFVSKYIYPIGIENMNLASGSVVSDLSSDQKFKNIVFTYFFLLKQLNEEYIKTKEECKSLLNFINDELLLS